MSAKSAIGKEVFTPRDEKMLAAVQVRRRNKKKIPFLATGGQGEYMTYICLSGQSPTSTPCEWRINLNKITVYETKTILLKITNNVFSCFLNLCFFFFCPRVVK